MTTPRHLPDHDLLFVRLVPSLDNSLVLVRRGLSSRRTVNWRDLLDVRLSVSRRGPRRDHEVAVVPFTFTLSLLLNRPSSMLNHSNNNNSSRPSHNSLSRSPSKPPSSNLLPTRLMAPSSTPTPRRPRH